MTPFDTDFATANDINEYYYDEYENRKNEPKPDLILSNALLRSAASCFSGGYGEKEGFIIAIKKDQRFQDEYNQEEKE